MLILSAVLPAATAADCDVVYDNDVSWSGLRHDSFSVDYREPFGALPLSSSVTLTLQSCAGDLDRVRLRVWDAAARSESWHELSLISSQTDPDLGPVDSWQVSLAAPDEPDILYYFFEVSSGSDTDYYVDDEPVFSGGGAGEVSDDYDDTRSFQISIYDPAMQVPAWYTRALVYQIFPDRFRDGDSSNNHTSGDETWYGQHQTIALPWAEALSGDCLGDDQTRAECFYGGDLNGITEKMDYLAALGVSALYLNPIFTAPTNHRYDTADYFSVDDDLGGDAALDGLLSAARAADVSVILDGVFNHVSAESPWFDLYDRHQTLGACESMKSDYRYWFFIPDIGTPAGTEDGQTVYCDGQTYEAWGTYFHLPKLNAADDEVRNVFFAQGVNSVAGYWLDRGASGWRLDVSSSIDAGAAQEPDNDYWEEFRSAVRAVDSEAVIIGEEWGDASSQLLGREYDTVMNYRFRAAVLDWLFDSCTGNGCTDGVMFSDNDSQEWRESGSIDALSTSGLIERLRSIEEDYPPMVHSALLNLLGSHDTARIGWLLTKISSDDAAVGGAKVRLATLLQYTWPGVPMVYYGDEVGLATASAWDGAVWQDDPLNRSPYPWADRGLSPDEDLLAWSVALGQARTELEALQSGAHEVLLADDDSQVLVFRRYTGSDSALILLNRSPDAQAVTVDVSSFWTDAELKEHLTGTTLAATGGQVSLTLSAYGGAILSESVDEEPEDTGTDRGEPSGGADTGPGEEADTDSSEAPVFTPVERECGCGGSGLAGLWPVLLSLVGAVSRARPGPGQRTQPR